MKKTKSLLMTAILLLSSSALKSQVSSDTHQPQKVDEVNVYSEILLPDNINYNQKTFGSETLYVPVCNYSNAKEQEMVSITFKGASKQSIMPVTAGIFNHDFKSSFVFEKGNEQSIQVPKGTYDMFVQFKKGTSFYVFKENIEVNDGDVIEFNQEEAVNDVTYLFYDETYEELFMDVYDGSTLIKSGNADNMTKITSFNNKEYGTLATILSKGFMPLNYKMEFYVNDLSDRYVIGNGTNIIANGTTYTYKDAITELKPGTCRELGGDNLVECTTTIDAPNLMDGANDVFVQGYTFTLLFKGLAIIGEKCFMSKNKCPQKTVKNMMYCPESDVDSDDMINVIYQPAVSNYYEIADNKRKYVGIRSCGMLGDNDGIKYINAGQDSDWGGLNVPKGERASQFYPGHPEFSYEKADGVMTIGNSCPAIGIRARRYKSGNNVKGWTTPFFTGRYGERFESNAYVLEIDEQKQDDGKTYGKIVDNLSTVDGMQCENVTEYVVDLNGEDFIAPTLQMVSFKDAEGRLTDRLENSKGSKLIFTGGDFDYIYNKDVSRSYYVCNSAEVEVSYSKHGDDNWQKLAVNEIPEKKFMPYFGNFYEACLDDVSGDKDNQWFDLMFYFKDAAGNYQKQTVCPAFQIKKYADTGIEDLCESKTMLVMMGDRVRLSDGEKADFEIRSMGGCVYSSSNSHEISIAGLQNGAYIIVAKTKNNGVYTKKIMVK